MPAKKRPSIFDIFEDFTKTSPFKREMEDWFREPFEAMIERFEESTPSELEDLVREEETPKAQSEDMVPSSTVSATRPSLVENLYFRSSETSDHLVEG